MSKLADFMDIPQNCEVGNTIYKKLFFENAQMNKVDRDIFTRNIDKIKWDYSLKPDNINIKPFTSDIREYNEVEFITVHLRSSGKTKRIAELVMRTIPYPMVLTFENSNEIRLFTGNLRTSQADSSKNTIEEFFFTDWIDLDNLDENDIALFEDLKLKNLNFSNFYTFYNCIIENIIRYNISKISHISSDIDIYELKDIYDEIININTKIDFIRGKIKKETQFNRVVKMNIQIKELKERRDHLFKKLN